VVLTPMRLKVGSLDWVPSGDMRRYGRWDEAGTRSVNCLEGEEAFQAEIRTSSEWQSGAVCEPPRE
jgi:hypothetical protein